MMCRMIFLLLALLGYVGMGVAQITQLGQCDSIDYMNGFVLDSFLGTWYEVGKSSTENADCISWVFTNTATGITVSNPSVVNNFLQTATGTATHTTNTAQLTLTMTPSNSITFGILNTDYTNYAIAVECVNLGDLQRSVNVWQLGRAPNSYAAEATSQMANTALGTIGLSVNNLQSIEHSTAACTQLPVIPTGEPIILPGQCNNNNINVVQNFQVGDVYYPEPVTGRQVPVVFPGQCDETISAINSFNMALFAGLWHEVQAYPKVQQTGTCVNHDFTTVAGNANTLNLVSNQVVNQFATSASGSVSFETTDGTGKLRLRMTVNGQEIDIPYWILSTDYTSYALVYSCTNRDDGNRNVHSWKLSRTQTLPAGAATAINTAMAAVQVLEEEYFQPISQTAASCLTLPVIPAGQPVILPGQCNNANINVVQNFQVGDFGGTWHEISSYYSANALGTCARADYTLVGSTVNVVNSQVVNQRLDTITGTATLIGTNSEGRLSVILDVQGIPITQELLVLDTDYTGYAVSYSCLDLPNNQRQVNSWILSRSRQITSASQTEVDRVINSYADLNTAYYQPTAQTDDACFYYPEPVTDLPVVFPGQCDETISAINSFNMALFAGLWHEVQAYPKVQQTGTCVNHDFTTVAGNANTLNLVSNQVVNQFATSASGSVSFETTDGTGKLRLRMTVNGQEIDIPYWILSTDYTSYALVYSCTNRDDGNRNVHSWKLSRTQTLPAGAATPINTAMAAVQVLEEEYFQPISQTAASCLTLPVIPAGQPVILPGQCNNANINVVQNFQVGDFGGTWHEISSYYSANALGTCARADYTLVGSTVNVVNSQVVNQRLDTITGTATLIGTNSEGRLSVILDVQGIPITQELLVLDTDYTGYAVSYSCLDLPNNQRQVNSWILSRSRQISAASQTEVDRVINSYADLNTAYYQPTAQTDDACFYYPEPVTDLPVVFPGQCDETISAINSFNMALFAGLWHEVQAYPKVQQTGTCVNHDFTTVAGNANTLNLVSNQVVNQFATSASGSVSFETTDGTGKLRLRMTVNGQEIDIPYWILSTDYTSYALVYSCTNRDDGNRNVHSWKLSRTQTLPAGAATPINTAMAAVQVLEEEYFQPISQTAASCLTLPVIPAGQPVILPGQCNNANINVVQNFQVGDFGGTWHEISSYYSANALGTCARADYTLVGSTVNVVNSQVVNQRLDTITGTATLIGTNSEGRLSVILDVQGIPITQELLVLDTDYTGYAVSYSCLDLPNNQRQVNSWILSRSRQISAASQTEVDRVINSYADLNTAYYQPTAQTDDACFYYPEPVTDLPVVFPGQCDETISAINSFNMALFAGLWHEVQAYPKVQQTGTCVNHDFTTVAGNANTLNLVSNQVVNQFATSASGSVSFETTDGTGKLRLRMTVNGQEIDIPYWILSTDYTSYALVYSCTNRDDGNRNVHSWKLSRTQTLPAGAATPINTAMAAVQVLEEEYFQPISQTAASCLTLPVIPAGQPVILPGQCNNANINVVQNFQVGDFGGTWHEISSYYSANALGTCARADYTLVGSTVNVVNSQVVNQRLDTITGTATLIGTNNEGRLSVILDVQGIPITQELLVLDTDYTGYAVSYSCLDLPNNQRQVNSWILSRSRQITAASQTEVDRVINSYADLNTAYYQPTAQTDDACFYYPEPVTDLPVVFPGQCDETISAVNSFNMALFAGLWHEVQAYPKVQQTGTCVNHDFTTVAGNANTLNLVSNQVVNQFATSASGSVSFETTDGTGKLRLRMTVNGQEIDIPYWILSTDYTSYALVYSCTNRDDGNRNVHSWKLSRTQTLPAGAVTPINTAMAAVQVLEEEYFQPISQTAASCLTLPVIPAGQPVILPGQCNNANINVMQNFQVGDFGGTWHEISSYYSANALGTCARADYTLVGSTVNVVNSQVVNQRLDTITGTATLIGTNSEGRLSVILDVQGIPITQELLVLDTDYTGYAVSYSCFDLPNNQRQVNSWILSRSRQITAASQTEVDRVINSYADLNTAYYQPTAQTDDACFYYPEPVTDLPVVFPGQCDETISAVNSFNMALFAGLWHEVQAYPKVQQTGTCVNHDFTTVAGNANTLNLVSNQVVNQFATSASGSVSFETTDGTGKLRLRMTVNGQEIDIPYWILSTDYTSYALVYSCTNRDDGNRNVHSWKLSRTQTLPAGAATPINTAMAAVQVLEEEYFQPISQTAASCLTLPVIPAGQPVILPGQCNNANINVVQNFQVGDFGGTWHEISSYYSANALGTCARADYTLVGSTVNVVNSQVVNQRLDTITGTATLIGTNSEGRLSVILDVQGIPVAQELLILDTDYTGYAVSYSCFDLPNNQRQVNSWILSRSRQISAASQTEVDRVINSYADLNTAYYQPTAQTDDACFYYPEPVTDLPVVFPGQCDETISAINSFNMALFAGLWHEVQAYPKVQQTGTCVNHEFTAVAGNTNTLNLVSNQVINQFPASASGSVSFDTTDGTGKLRLRMIVNGQDIEIPYWVLTTDYTSYALVYSCINMGADYRSVHSWKLSRTQTLPAGAATPINTAMAAVQVLEEEYFQPIIQTEAACFTNPGIPAGQAIILPGQCNNANLNVVQNFQVGDFGGTWHEIASYYSANALGTCARADYTLVGSTVNVVNTQVLNQRLDTITGTATLIGTNNEARLSVVLDVQGIPVTQELLILDTDYTGYAVSYSCFDLPNNQRQVNSWILSRSQQISAASQTEVNRVINSYFDLNADYYQPTAQTDEACFYYPVFQPGVPVEFPGQCDMSIPVQTNFDPTQYVGLWHDIESYPSTFQQGTCNNAFYTLTPEGTVDVFNTQVVNERLETMTGVAFIPDLNEPAKLRVSFPIGDTDEMTETDYWILATDYTTYSLVYTCQNLANNRRMVFSWKMSRTKELTDAARTAMNAVIDTIPVLDSQYYPNRDQSPAGCFYFPEPVSGQRVVFPGQCDENINAVSAFNMAAFAGVWHEVEAYPKEPQTGTCVNHEFTAVAGNANTLNLVSNQVINQFATSASGSVTFESTDGTGKLRLNMIVNGQPIEIPYWILSTNYNSYALVYSCINIDDDYRSVHSWKLSRTQTLQPDAAAPINTAMAAVQVLEQVYFDPIDQSATGCFAYPNIPAGDPIILPGQCQPVTPVTGFQPNAFPNNWYEVSSYPSESQSGTCSRAEYNIGSDGVITIRNSMVVDGKLQTQSGTARLASDGTGVLDVTYVLDDGGELTMTYYILGTDYESFALVYSCRDVTANTRQVYSWILSTTPELNEAAQEAINTAISNTDGLFEQFYQETQQTAEACFYVPDLVPGQSALFRGACEPVNGMNAFNAAQYLGWWHEIERYPTEEYLGQCTSARFTQTGNAIQVVQTNINDRVIDETTSTAVLSNAGTIAITKDGETMVWTVIDTDYNTYSLLYTCQNVDTDWGVYRRVWSAKHSKTRSLTPAANNAMNPFIAANPVLDQGLYENVDQSNEACFHYREPPVEQVILDGLCDTNIPFQNDFDVARFAGTWYQHERYPYPQVDNAGTCVGARYTMDGDNINVQNWEVLDGELNTITGTATANAATATLTVTLEDVAESMNLRILTTDYDSYALAYTCTDIPPYQRSVGAFKLSRGRQLTPTSQTAINTYMADRLEFNQDYFIPIQHNADCVEPSSAFLAKSSIIVMLVCIALQLVM